MNWGLMLEVIKIVQQLVEALKNMGLRSGAGKTTVEIDLSGVAKAASEGGGHAAPSSDQTARLA